MMSKVVTWVMLICISVVSYRATFFLAGSRGVEMPQWGGIFAAVAVFLISLFVVIPFVNRIYKKDKE